MAIDDTVKSLISKYAKLRDTKKNFEINPNPDNIDARTGIIQEDGQPAYEVQAGTAGAVLRDRIQDNLEELTEYLDTADRYQEFKDEFFNPLSNEGKARAYSTLITDNDEVKGTLQMQAIQRIAVKYDLKNKLSQADSSFATKPEGEQIQAYLGVINQDKRMGEDFIKDASIKATSALELADKLDLLLIKGKVEDAVNILNDKLGIQLAALYRNAGQMASAKALIEKTVKKQRAYAINLMAENSYVINDVEKALERTPRGYATAAAEVYSVYNNADEDKFRKDYAKAKTDGSVTNLDEFRKKSKKVTEKRAIKKAA